MPNLIFMEMGFGMLTYKSYSQEEKRNSWFKIITIILFQYIPKLLQTMHENSYYAYKIHY